MRVRQPCGKLNLPTKALGADGQGTLRVEHFDGDIAVVPEIASMVDTSHPPTPDLPIGRIASVQGRADQCENGARGVCHP